MIKENSYFNETVKSLGFEQEGNSVTVGVMLAGEYTFSTGAPERMTVVKGQLVVKREGESVWHTFNNGDLFEVAGNSSFELKVAVNTAYLCEYL
ncbi:pyrimidine/purine nucleoside phosphorylase [Vibrio porteresiae]|uniref:Pyrimidine/purine nucleoside phosphorylase n=1 Tax=Vibrio porteresiae DSM 19223 TaxID=1123496 RepID=A0ABZ0QN35_9VIBR|nr:pyrimidine/purine nucleoside phosphorylase [Vibrio porteresiae]WPC76925.1 pyrimidine/purine nucleoside phosphorylase [Vibrio porteresiae DSM 19223]